MANKTYAQIISSAAEKLADTSKTIFSDTNLDEQVQGALDRVSRARPWRYRLGSNLYSCVKTTVADSWVISLSSGDAWKYLWTDELRYQYNYPTHKKGFVDYVDPNVGGGLELEFDYAPSAAYSVYLYLAKQHILQKAIGTSDTAGAVKTAGAVDDVTLALKSLGTGTINEDTKLTIAGDATVYHVISTATIGTNEATVSIWPPLQAVASVDAVVTLALENTVPAELEDAISRLIAAKAAESKSVLIYQQAHSAITSLTTAAAAIAGIAAIITQARADITAGLLEAAKVSAILDTANTELDKIGAQITLAITATAAGKTEADKMAALITAAGTAIGAIAARVTQAITDLGSARTAIAAGATAITEADAEFDLINPQVDLAVTALASGASLLNTVPVGGGSSDYHNQAASDVGAAGGFATSGQVYLQKGSANFNNANSNLGLANGEINSGLAKVREAQVNLEAAQTNAASNRAQLEDALGDVRNAQEYFREASGYMAEGQNRLSINNGYLSASAREVSAAGAKVSEAQASMSKGRVELSITSAGKYYEQWGMREEAEVERMLIRMTKTPSGEAMARE